MFPYWVYAVTLLTHAPGFYWLYYLDTTDWILVSVTLLSSLLMHVSERKHNLPGLILGKYHALLLNCDRTTAILSAGYMVYLLSVRQSLLWMQGLKGLLALITNFLSENFRVDDWYSFWHGLWHVSAFYLLGETLYLTSGGA